MTAQQLNGDPRAVSVDRGVAELRGGRVIQIVDGAQRYRIACVEMLDEALLTRLHSCAASTAVYLTAHRARALGIATAAVGIPEAAARGLDALRALAGLSREDMPSLQGVVTAAVPPAVEAAFVLAKRARLVPAVLAAAVDGPDADVLELDLDAVEHFASLEGVRLDPVSSARVPLADHEDCRFVLFRDRDAGREHLAVVLGQPEDLDPVPVRLHSSCLTGDLLGSLRCDCGEQLRTAVATIGASGGGVLLYLSQEGRNIGLANKLRAYGLQDGGLDTIEADLHLGFNSDERDFRCAASMLESLGVHRIALFTNNPRKMEAMRKAGIDVAQRQPLVATLNSHNARYVRTKRERAGHL